MKEILQRVWGEETGFIWIGRLDTGGQWYQKYYEYPGRLTDFINDATQWNTWANVYFGVHLYKPGKRTKDNAHSIRALWIDCDNVKHTSVSPKLSICWQTSPGRYQGVWLLSHPIDPHRAEEVNKFLTYKNKGDTGKWALATMLRVPGSANFKYTPPVRGHVVWDDGPVYSIEQLEPSKEELDAFRAKENPPAPLPTEFPTYTEALTQYGKQISPAAWEILRRTPQADDDWSETLWRLERLLLEAKVPPEAVFSIVKDSAWNKFRRDGRPDLHLWQDIQKAMVNGGPIEPATPKDKQEEPTSFSWLDLDHLLTYTRQPEWLVEGIWMQSNVGWIAGVGKSYKSTLSLDLALSIASGQPFLNKFPVVQPGPVLMVQEEDPVWRVARRVQAMSRSKKISACRFQRKGVGQYSFTVSNQLVVPLYMLISSGFNFRKEEMIARLEESIANFRPKMVVIDPWFVVMPGVDEYKAGDVTEALSLIKQWRDTYDCAFALVHHYRKGSGDSRERLYGSMAYYAWSENSLFVGRKPESNMIEIHRDIKDALVEKPIVVEFHDTSDDYSFNVLEAVQRTDSEHKVISFLRSAPGASKISRQEIAEATGLTGKTVTAVLKRLAEQDYVMIEYVGRGGQMYVQTTHKLEQEEGGEFDFV